MIGAPESDLDLTFNGEAIGLTLHLLSPDDPAIRKAVRRIEGRITRLYARRLVAQSKDDPEAPLDDDSADAEWGELTYQEREARALASVTGWTWGRDASWKGEQPAFSTAMLREMIEAARVDIVAQIDAHLRKVAIEQRAAEKKPKAPSRKRSG